MKDRSINHSSQQIMMKSNDSFHHKKNNYNAESYQLQNNVNPSFQQTTGVKHGHQMRSIFHEGSNYVDRSQSKERSLHKIVNEEVVKLIKPILFRLSKVEVQLKQFKEIIENNSSYNHKSYHFDRSYKRSNQFFLPQEPKTQFSYHTFAYPINIPEFNDEQYLNMTDEELLHLHFKHVRVEERLSSEWGIWFEKMLSIFKQRRVHKTKGYAEETKMTIIGFIDFGERNGNYRDDMIKAAGISRSSYKRWNKKLLNGARKIEVDVDNDIDEE